MKIHILAPHPNPLPHVGEGTDSLPVFLAFLHWAGLSSLGIVLAVFALGVAGTGTAHAAVPGTITSVRVSNVSGESCKQAPVTFGQPFRKGDLPRGKVVQAYLDGKPLPTQTNIKARNPDGSTRHAILTVLVPCDAAEDHARLALAARSSARSGQDSDVTLKQLLQTKFDAGIELKVNGETWSLDARRLLQQAARDGGCAKTDGFCKRWLNGSLASDWVVGGGLKNDSGDVHPHLAAYFAIRAYGSNPVQRVRVDVIVENDWAYQPDPHNYHYDATIHVGGEKIYTLKDLEHYRQARWHKAFWWGKPGILYAALNSDYLQASRAVPHYQDVHPSDKLLDKVPKVCAPMDHCNQTKTMSNTGAQPSIGPLPRWTSAYVVDTDYRAYRWMLADSDALGSYGIHYRSRTTGHAVSLERHPCMTEVGAAEVAKCPVPPHADDRFPPCRTDCDSPLVPNASHHPAPAYVAYLVTGNWYYKEELAFWADWVIFWQNQKYRHYSAGLVHDQQVRGQAWSLRTLGDAAWGLPDRAPLKDYFNQAVANNIQWYNKHYTDNPDANKLHITVGFNAIVYPAKDHERVGIAPWQQSFFDWAVGNLADLGFDGAARLRDWFAHYQIGTMISPDYCWQLASAYKIRVRDKRKSPFYKSLGEVYRKSFPKLENVRCGSQAMAKAITSKRGHDFNYPVDSMIGYPYSPVGFPANFQVGMAAAADSNVPGADKAWKRFANRAVQPDYSDEPQFAVLPRTQ